MRNALFLALCLAAVGHAAERTAAPHPLSLPQSTIPSAADAAAAQPAAVSAEAPASVPAAAAAPSAAAPSAAASAVSGSAAAAAEPTRSQDAQASGAAGEGEASSNTKLFDGGAEAVGLPPRLSGIGPRGHLGVSPAHTPENEAKMGDLGAIWWYTKIFHVPSEEAALAQDKLSEVILDITKPEDKRQANVHMRSLYIIDPSVTIQGAGHDKEDFAKIAAAMPDKPVYEVRDGKLVRLDPAVVKERLSPEHLAPVVQFAEEGAHVRAFGWHFTDPYGIFLLDDMNPATSRTFKKLEADARARFYPAPKNGVPATERLVVSFNKDLRGVMEGAKDQERKGQSKAASRVNDAMIAGFMKMEAEGKTMSVEVWKETAQPDGTTKRALIGGVFGSKMGGMVTINSIYYGDEPDIARFAFLALRDRLKAAGINFMPAVMVSSWSATMKGKLITGAEAVRVIDQRPKDAKPDFTTEWAPQAAPEIRARPFGYPGHPVMDNRKA